MLQKMWPGMKGVENNRVEVVNLKCFESSSKLILDVRFCSALLVSCVKTATRSN